MGDRGTTRRLRFVLGVSNYAKVGAALVDAREQGRAPFAAIEAVVPWESFSASVKEAAELARDQNPR